MATDTRHKSDRPAREHATDQSTGPQEERRTDSSRPASYDPFSLMRQGVNEMERWWNQFGRGRGWLSPSTARSFFSQMGPPFGEWSPAIEAFHRGDELVIRVEAPGMNRQDLNVEVGDDTLTIRGERQQEQRGERDGVFWTERGYGSFTRVIPLPPGAIADSAKASFANGVLEVVMQAPPAETRRGRKIEVSGKVE